MVTSYRPLPSNQADAALAFVRRGGRLVVPSASRQMVIDAKVLTTFEQAGHTLLKAEGDGYRLLNGKSSVYLLPGQLMVEEVRHA